jgi:hypothetical protein
LLAQDYLEVAISSRNIKYYESLGYIIPKYKDDHYRWKVKIGTKIIVKIRDIPHNSNIHIPVTCDYCGILFYPTVTNYYIGHNIIIKDSCKKCTGKKTQAVYMFNNNNIDENKVGGHYRVDYNTVLNEFLNHGLILQINESEYANIDIKTPLPFICSVHEGIQYKQYNKVKEAKFCCEKGYREQNIGENNPRWKGGLSSEDEMFRKSIEYKDWRLEVYKRDNYTCQCCGDGKGGNLQAHHIENFSNNEELRLELDNGITLCNLCHNFSKYGSFHHVYGTHNNTKEQLKEYIQRYKQGEFTNLQNKNAV